MAKKRSLRKDRLAAFVRLLVLGGVLCVTVVTLLNQQSRLADLLDEQKQLEAKYNDLLLEEEKRKQVLDFTETDEYIERYARDKLGMVKENDIKFVVPTPTPGPVQTISPEDMPADDELDNTPAISGEPQEPDSTQNSPAPSPVPSPTPAPKSSPSPKPTPTP